MYSLRISIVSALLLSLVVVPFAFADDDDDRDNSGKGRGKEKKAFMWTLPFGALGTTTDALQAQIRSLQETLRSLKAQREALDDDDDDSATSTKAQRDALKVEIKETKAEIKNAKRELKFVRSLTRGMSGDDVRDLQELLAQDPTLFSMANITGFFGPLTEEALRKFQRKHGIEAIGIFGPKTQARILSLFVGKPLPPGIIKRLGLETSSTTPGQGFVTLCHKPAGASPQTLVIAIPALGAHLAHGDTVGVCSGSGTSTTTDTTAPNLSGIVANNISTTSARIQWTTNEAATSRVEYGTTTSYGSAVSDSSLLTSHSMDLTGLLSSILYHFRVISKDAAGNTATSSDMTFTTGTPDTTAPIISAVSVGSISSTTAQISWTTNESASSRVWYGTTTPLTLASPTLTLFDGALLLAHSLNLSSLTASSTYHFVVESKDASGNTATSSDAVFVTGN